MLTRKLILKVTRLLDQTGEARPGFLHDGQANLRGQNATTARAALARAGLKRRKGAKEKQVKVRLSYQDDARTGEPRLVVK